MNAPDTTKFFSSSVAAELGLTDTHLLRLIKDRAITPPADQIALPKGGTLLLWTRHEIDRARVEYQQHKIEWLAARKLPPGDQPITWEQIRAIVSETKAGRAALQKLDDAVAEMKAHLEDSKREHASAPSAAAILSGSSHVAVS